MTLRAGDRWDTQAGLSRQDREAAVRYAATLSSVLVILPKMADSE